MNTENGEVRDLGAEWIVQDSVYAASNAVSDGRGGG
jgi:hypothetical protein